MAGAGAGRLAGGCAEAPSTVAALHQKRRPIHLAVASGAAACSIPLMIRSTGHVRQRVLERRLALAWIEAAIADPDWTGPDPDPALTRSYMAIPAFGGRILPVVHRPEGADMLMVTAHFDRGAERP